MLGDQAEQKGETKRSEENLTLFREEMRFVDDHAVALGGEEYTAEKSSWPLAADRSFPTRSMGCRRTSISRATTPLDWRRVRIGW